MTTSKKIIFTTTTFLLSVFSVILVSCDKTKNDKCSSVTCAYGGVCIDGVCKCAVGYEGTNCQTISRTKFLKAWNVNEKGTISPQRNYALAIEKDTAINGILIKNMYNYFTGKIAAKVVNDSIFIANQATEGKVIYGKGFISADGTTVKLWYQVIDGATGLKDDFGVDASLSNSKPSVWN